MPAQIVVVKRSRRRAFSILWVAPAWARAFLSSLRRSPFFATPPAAEMALAVRKGTALPGLVWTESGRHRCVGCRRCVEICPGRALATELSGDEDAASGLRRFELEPGRCIACGYCVEVCPETALVMREGSARVGPGAAPARREIVDLLQAGE